MTVVSPSTCRALALAGADLVLVPHAGGQYVALCNRVGREERLDFSGESYQRHALLRVTRS